MWFKFYGWWVSWVGAKSTFASKVKCSAVEPGSDNRVGDLCLTSLILVITWLKLDPSLIVWLLVGGWLGWSPRAWNPFLSIWTCVCLFSIFATTEIKTWPPDLTWFELITSKGCLWPSFYLLICNKSSCSYCLLVFVCFVGILACPLVGLFKFSV